MVFLKSSLILALCGLAVCSMAQTSEELRIMKENRSRDFKKAREGNQSVLKNFDKEPFLEFEISINGPNQKELALLVKAELERTGLKIYDLYRDKPPFGGPLPPLLKFAIDPGYMIDVTGKSGRNSKGGYNALLKPSIGYAQLFEQVTIARNGYAHIRGVTWQYLTNEDTEGSFLEASVTTDTEVKQLLILMAKQFVEDYLAARASK